MLWDVIPNTRKSVSSDTQTLRASVVFFNPLLSVWISVETLFLVFWHITSEHNETQQRFILTAGNVKVNKEGERQRVHFVPLPDVTSHSSLMTSYQLDFLQNVIVRFPHLYDIIFWTSAPKLPGLFSWSEWLNFVRK